MLNCGEFPSYKAELAVSLGGPLGNLCSGALLWALTLLCRRSGCSTAFLLPLCRGVIPLSLFVAGWNLLPISGFDGGRILHCLLLLTPRRAPSPRTADLLLTITSTTCVLSLWLLSVYLVLRTARALSLFLFCVQLFWGLWGEQLRR
jgi:Zn-dependent protease